MSTIFKNIVGEINLSDFYQFKPDPELKPETARYFIIKKGLKKKVNSETGEEVQEYNAYVYSTGHHVSWNRPIDTPRCLDIFGQWRFSFNGRDFLKAEMLEINMDK